MIRKILLTLALLAVPAVSQAAPARWSLERASFGLDAKAVNFAGPERGSAFLPGAYLSWSLASNLSAAGTVERDFAGHLTIGQVGLRALIWQNLYGQVYAGGSLVSYGDIGATGLVDPTSWNASIHGAWNAVESHGRTVMWVIGSYSFDPENDIKMARLGLRWQAIGGKDL